MGRSGDARSRVARAAACASIESVTVVTPQVSVGRIAWVLLSYRLRREPSSPRIALWRELKRLGADQVLDGLVVLPLDSRNREQLEWLADEVEQAGGDAMIWIGEARFGLDVLLRGLSMTHEDEQLLALAAALFDGLYEFKKRAILLGGEPS